MNKHILTCIAIMGLFLLLFYACEFATNPLLFDGSVVAARYRVDVTDQSTFSQSIVVDLNEALEGFQENKQEIDVDSIKFYNITILIDSTAGTPSGTTITGTIIVDGDTLVTLTNVPLDIFLTEQSIFKNIHPGLKFNNAGIEKLKQIFKKYPVEPLPTVKIYTEGYASSNELHFTVQLKLYTQVYSNP